jgi:hypothetical protein
MLIDLRVYTMLPPRFYKFLRSYEEVGFALTTRYLGTTLGIFVGESGVQNRTFQFFMYESSAHRDRCRAAMLSDPGWQPFVKMDAAALLEQKNTLLRPADFFTIDASATSRQRSAGPARLFELQTWCCRMGAQEAALTALREGGAALLERHGSLSIGYFIADTGDEQQILRLAAYIDGEDRDRCRAAARADAACRLFQTNFENLLRHQESTLLLPIKSSPLQ